MQDTLERHPPAPPPTLRSRNYSIHPILTSRLQQLFTLQYFFSSLSPGSGPKPGVDQSCPSWISSNLQGQISSRIYLENFNWNDLINQRNFLAIISYPHLDVRRLGSLPTRCPGISPLSIYNLSTRAGTVLGGNIYTCGPHYLPTMIFILWMVVSTEQTKI